MAWKTHLTENGNKNGHSWKKKRAKNKKKKMNTTRMASTKERIWKVIWLNLGNNRGSLPREVTIVQSLEGTETDN